MRGLRNSTLCLNNGKILRDRAIKGRGWHLPIQRIVFLRGISPGSPFYPNLNWVCRISSSMHLTKVMGHKG